MKKLKMERRSSFHNELVKELPAQGFITIFLIWGDLESVAGSQNNDSHEKKSLKNMFSAENNVLN